MQTATVEDVQARLPQILDALAPGGEVVITRNGAPVGRLTRPADPLDVGVRIAELKNLRDGWLDGMGVAPAHDLLDWLAGAIGRYLPAGLPRPYLFPTPEGGVRAEWTAGPCELSLDVDPATRAGRWHTLNLTDDSEQSRTMDLTAPSAWAWLTAEVRRLAGAGS